ncbi:MAG: hypothetical protein WBD20_17370 [Pirellulaceae bacterium]
MPFEKYLTSFANCKPLDTRVLHVLNALPDDIQEDFLDDPRFQITVDNFQEGKGWTLVMDLPGADGGGSRCVVLKPKLATCDEAFAWYVIAHEFAHAFLRNGGWDDITDPEEAADALAAHWGFVRPRSFSGWFS